MRDLEKAQADMRERMRHAVILAQIKPKPRSKATKCCPSCQTLMRKGYKFWLCKDCGHKEPILPE